MGPCNAWHIHSIGCLRRRCGMLQRSSRQLADTLSQQGTRVTGQNLWEGVWLVACRRKPECPEKSIYQGGYGIGKANSRTTTRKLHWWKASVQALNQPALPQRSCESWYLINTWYQLNWELNRPICFQILNKWVRQGIEPMIYCTISESFTNVPLKFCQNCYVKNRAGFHYYVSLLLLILSLLSFKQG